MAQVTFILSPEMRTSRSPFYAEGTDLNYDIPDRYPVPNQCTILDEKGIPVELRYLPNSQYIKKQDQIKKESRPEKVSIDDNAMDKLTFIFGRNVLDDKRDKVAIDYLMAAGWRKENETARLDGTKIIYELYDEKGILEKSISDELLTMDAIKAIMAMDETTLNGMYILATSGTALSAASETPQKKQYALINVAKNNPKFIIDGIQGRRNEAVIEVTNAINAKLIDLTVTGFVAMRNATNESLFDQWIEITDTGGQDAKMNRLVEHLLTDAGQKDYEVLKRRLKNIR